MKHLIRAWALWFGACADDAVEMQPVDPNTAPQVAVDRFGAGAMLFARGGAAAVPDANAPIDFDTGPFITRGLSPDGGEVRYYNFDARSIEPAAIYVFFADGESAPVSGQLNVVDAIPGDPYYNDFWRVHRVQVPADYRANTVTSLDEIHALGFTIEATDTLVNCPVAPAGSTATLRFAGGDSTLKRGWYRGQIVHYFEFGEAPITGMTVPLSPIYVAFNDNAAGPASGFRTEPASDQTHNVVASVPGDPDYSPLWLVNVYDNAEFESVADLATAMNASILAPGAAMVNCPIVEAP
jgi:hypothetical protein